jgi:hypothetical protein
VIDIVKTLSSKVRGGVRSKQQLPDATLRSNQTLNGYRKEEERKAKEDLRIIE